MTQDEKEYIAMAYGLLWQVHGGKSYADNIMLAYAARKALFACLTREEREAAIEAAMAPEVFKVLWPQRSATDVPPQR
jgi:hypothetical protein